MTTERRGTPTRGNRPGPRARPRPGSSSTATPSIATPRARVAGASWPKTSSRRRSSPRSSRSTGSRIGRRCGPGSSRSCGTRSSTTTGGARRDRRGRPSPPPAPDRFFTPGGHWAKAPSPWKSPEEALMDDEFRRGPRRLPGRPAAVAGPGVHAPRARGGGVGRALRAARPQPRQPPRPAAPGPPAAPRVPGDEVVRFASRRRLEDTMSWSERLVQILTLRCEGASALASRELDEPLGPDETAGDVGPSARLPLVPPASAASSGSCRRALHERDGGTEARRRRQGRPLPRGGARIEQAVAAAIRARDEGDGPMVSGEGSRA